MQAFRNVAHAPNALRWFGVALGLLLPPTASAGDVISTEIIRPAMMSAGLNASTGTAANALYVFTGIIKRETATCNVHATSCGQVQLVVDLPRVVKGGPQWVSQIPTSPIPLTVPTTLFKAGVATASIGGMQNNGASVVTIDDAWVQMEKPIDQPERLALHILLTAQSQTGVPTSTLVRIPYHVEVFGRFLGGGLAP